MEAFLDTFVEVLSWILRFMTLYTGLIGFLFFLPRRKYKVTSPKTRFAVLIPARNEENVIADIIESVQSQHYPAALYDIFVIPNNCTDRTAEVAAEAGAKLLFCTGVIRGKGDVLHQVLAQLMGSYDAYCVFDADNLLDPAFLARMNDAVQSGALVAKGRQKASNPYESWVSGCYDLYIESANTLHSRPRESLGLSAKLIGTGFMVTDELLQRMGGWNAFTMTEDTEFAAQCALHGVRIRYVPEAIHYDEQPTGFALSLRQRRRWSAGVQIVANRYVGKLLTHPNPYTLDYAIFVNMIYVQLLLLIPAIHGMIGLSLSELLTAVAVALGSFCLGTVAMAFLLCLTAGRSPWRMMKSILTYPFFTASWYPLHILGLVAKPKAWTAIPHKGKQKDKRK